MLEEHERLQRSYMRLVQAAANCEFTGKPCREPARCGCHLEMHDDLAEE